jgi:hypothetical protein
VTTSSELLSYSHPTDIKKFRSETALIVKTWKEYDLEIMQEHGREATSYENPTGRIEDGEMYGLTIEMRSGTIIARAVQPCLLLILVGHSNNPHNEGDIANRFHVEVKGDSRYPPSQALPDTMSFEESVPDESIGKEQDQGDVPRPNGDQSNGSQASQHSSKPGTGTHSPQSSEQTSIPAQEHDKIQVEDDGQAAAILHIQRLKLDSMVDWLAQQLKKHDFVFTEDLG